DVLAYVERGAQDRQDRQEKSHHSPDDRIEKMSPMRKAIADRMIASRRISAHVHTVFEVDFSTIAKIRESKKNSYLSFIIKAVADALRTFAILNASVDGDSIVYRKDINVGVA